MRSQSVVANSGPSCSASSARARSLDGANADDLSTFPGHGQQARPSQSPRRRFRIDCFALFHDVDTRRHFTFVQVLRHAGLQDVALLPFVLSLLVHSFLHVALSEPLLCRKPDFVNPFNWSAAEAGRCSLPDCQTLTNHDEPSRYLFTLTGRFSMLSALSPEAVCANPYGIV
jgi:hypothetical protein